MYVNMISIRKVRRYQRGNQKLSKWVLFVA